MRPSARGIPVVLLLPSRTLRMGINCSPAAPTVVTPTSPPSTAATSMLHHLRCRCIAVSSPRHSRLDPTPGKPGWRTCPCHKHVNKSNAVNFSEPLAPNTRGERRATRHRHPRMGTRPVVWPVRSTAWFGWECPVSHEGVRLLPRPCPLVDHLMPYPYSCRYLITSSAWKRSVGGMVRPSAWAVLRLMTSSNL